MADLGVMLHGLRLRGESHAADLIESLAAENERLSAPPTGGDRPAYVYGVFMPSPAGRVMGPMSSRRVAEQFCGSDLSRLRRRPVYAYPAWEVVPGV